MADCSVIIGCPQGKNAASCRRQFAEWPPWKFTFSVTYYPFVGSASASGRPLPRDSPTMRLHEELRMNSNHIARHVAAGPLAAAITLLILSAAAPRAQQPPPTGTPPPKPLVPLTAGTLAGNPDSFYGEWVSVTGVV